MIKKPVQIWNYYFNRLISHNNLHESRIKNILKKKFRTEIGPDYVTIDITNRCNLNCIACWTYSPLLKGKKPEKNWFIQELSYETIKKLVDDLKKLKTREIRLTGGGEPFIHPRIMEIIKLIKKKRFALDITTNFTLLDKKKINEIVSYNVDNITASVWAATPEMYVKTHPNQKEKSFETIKENLIYLNKIKKNTKVVISNVISNINYYEIKKMVSFGAEVNADEIYFTMIDPIEGATESLLLNKKQQNLLNKNFLEIIKEYEEGRYNKLKIDNPENFLRRISNKLTISGKYDQNLILKIPCTVGWTFSRIMANGDVAPCCRGVMIPSGNINKESFRQIWNGEKQKKFRQIGLKLKDHPLFIEKVGCMKTCDNLMQNIETFDKINSYITKYKEED